MTKSKLFPYLEAGFAATVWGASFIATKVALKDVSPITIVWMRFAMGVIILGLAVALRKQFALPNKNEWGYFALLGFLGITFHQWLQSNALKTSEASTTAWIVATTPVFMALLGWLILKEKLSGIKTLGILLAFVWCARRYFDPDQFDQLGGLLCPLTAWIEKIFRKPDDLLRDAAGVDIFVRAVCGRWELR
jgi:drug/metabolite transporter (DMT)-like permease